MQKPKEPMSCSLSIPGLELLIKKMARSYCFDGMSEDDLCQESWVAVLSAKHKIDKIESAGKLHYARKCIQQALLDYSFSNQRPLRMITTKGQRKAACNIRKYFAKGEEPTEARLQYISASLGVSLSDVKVAHQFIYFEPLSVSAAGEVTTSSGEIHLHESTRLEANLYNRNPRAIQIEQVWDGLELLPHKHRNLLYLRSFKATPLTLKQVGERLAMSWSGVRKAEIRAIEMLRKQLLSRSFYLGALNTMLK